MFLFEDGRIAYTKQEADNIGQECLEIGLLPEAPFINGKTGFCIADVKTREVKFKYIDVVEEEIIDPEEPIPGLEQEKTQLDRIEETVNKIAEDGTSWDSMAMAISEGVNDV